MNYLLIYFAVLLPFITLPFAEAEIEGKYGGGGKNPRFFKFGPFVVRRYHFYMNWVTLPLFIFISFVVGNFDFKLLLTLCAGGYLGGVLQDFLWFIVNHNYGIKKFNSKDVHWLVWWKIGKFEMPYFYYTHIILTISLMYLVFTL